MDKKAKEILRAIQKRADENNTYYVILKTYWSYASGFETRIANEMGVNDEIWKDLYNLNERYKRFCHYIKEIKPNWKTIEWIDYADNSIEVIEVNNQGEKRNRMIKAPSGDLCY